MLEPEIHFSPAARREICKLNRKTQKLVMEKAEALRACPRPPGIERIRGRPEFLRMAISRTHVMIYSIVNLRVIVILVLRDKQDAFRGLDNLDEKLTAALNELRVADEGVRLLVG